MHKVIKEGNEMENKTVYKPATIQMTMIARKISAGNPADLATISHIEMLIPVVLSFLITL